MRQKFAFTDNRVGLGINTQVDASLAEETVNRTWAPKKPVVAAAPDQDHRRLRVMLSVALLASLIPLQGAEGYPQATSGCTYGPGTLSYRFIDTTDEFDDEIAWTDESRDLARVAFDRISDALDDRGDPLANVSEESLATYDIVLRDGTLGMSVGGLAAPVMIPESGLTLTY